MEQIFVILILDGIVEDCSVFAYEEQEAAISTFKHHYRVQIKQDPDADERINEIIETGYIGFGRCGQSTIQMKIF